jgi:hypothetical protein
VSGAAAVERDKKKQAVSHLVLTVGTSSGKSKACYLLVVAIDRPQAAAACIEAVQYQCSSNKTAAAVAANLNYE